MEQGDTLAATGADAGGLLQIWSTALWGQPLCGRCWDHKKQHDSNSRLGISLLDKVWEK